MAILFIFWFSECILGRSAHLLDPLMFSECAFESCYQFINPLINALNATST